MVSFWVTAGFTILATWWGYFRNSVRVPQNGADWVLKWPVVCVARVVSTLGGRLLTIEQRRQRQRQEQRHGWLPNPESILAKASPSAQEMIEGFTLSLSDQQLVTGLALLIAVFFKGNISVYTMLLSVSIARFSTTIHLTTLVVLRT